MKTKIFLMITAWLCFHSLHVKKIQSLIDQTSIDLADDDAVADAVYEDVFNTADNATIILDQMVKGDDAKSRLLLLIRVLQ